MLRYIGGRDESPLGSMWRLFEQLFMEPPLSRGVWTICWKQKSGQCCCKPRCVINLDHIPRGTTTKFTETGFFLNVDPAIRIVKRLAAGIYWCQCDSGSQLAQHLNKSFKMLNRLYWKYWKFQWLRPLDTGSIFLFVCLFFLVNNSHKKIVWNYNPSIFQIKVDFSELSHRQQTHHPVLISNNSGWQAPYLSLSTKPRFTNKM